MVEVQCSSCHTRYRVDERVLPEGTPTFKCSRCGHVFTIEPRQDHTPPSVKPKAAPRVRSAPDDAPAPVEPPPAEPAPLERPKPQMNSLEAEKTLADTPPATPKPDLSPRQPSEPAQTASPAPKASRPKISTAELLSRPMPKPEEAAEGENLAFDFSNDTDALEDDSAAALAEVEGREAAVDRSSARWTVGADPRAEELDADHHGFELDEQLSQPAGDPPRTSRAQPKRRTRRDEFVDEAEAPVYNAGVAHSARFFLGLLLLALFAFAATTIAIHTAPASARSLLNQLPVIGDRFASPITPARMIVLHDVHSNYRRGKDGRPLLVIDGQAENVTPAPLHAVAIAAALEVSPGKPVARREVYCGNNLATRTITEMTPHEIDFFQSLPPAATLRVDASASCPFVIVFTQPTTAATHFALTITRAAIAAPPPVGSNS